MLKEDISKEVQKRLGLADEEFSLFVEAVKSEEETELTLPDVHVFTQDEFDQYKQNTKKTKKPAWIEEAIKEWKNEKGLEISGKSFDAIFEHAKTEALKEAKLKPDERFNELKGKYDLTLKELDTLNEKLEKKDSEMFFNSTRSQLTAKIGFETAIKPEQIFTLYAQEFEPVKDEGFLRVKKKGANETLKDDRYNPFEAESHFLQYAENFKVKDSIGKPGANGKTFDPNKPIFNNKAEYNKWVEDNKPDDRTKGEVWLSSLKEHPEIAE